MELSIIQEYREFVKEMKAEGISVAIIRQSIIDFYDDAQYGAKMAQAAFL